MELELIRRYRGERYTIGTLSLNGVRFCDTLEDRVRDLSHEMKVSGRTAIPKGVYRVILTRSPRFGRDVPRLVDVPGFEGILIHRGNTSEDTSGCILVGENKVEGRVINSTPYEKELCRLLREAIRRGEDCRIHIREGR